MGQGATVTGLPGPAAVGPPSLFSPSPGCPPILSTQAPVQSLVLAMFLLPTGPLHMLFAMPRIFFLLSMSPPSPPFSVSIFVLIFLLSFHSVVIARLGTFTW